MAPDGETVALIQGDGRTREAKHWREWLLHVPAIRDKFCEWSDGFDPFHFNEAASVAVLANAASLAGYLALTEYVVPKRHLTRGRPFRQGRCDLWVAHTASLSSWAFEFKQSLPVGKTRPTSFGRKLRQARTDARALDRTEADRRVGCLIIVPSESAHRPYELQEHIDELCSDANLAFRIGGGRGAIWLAFSFVE